MSNELQTPGDLVVKAGSHRHSSLKIRVAIVVNTPAPYRDPLFDILAADPELEPLVLYGAVRHWDQQWSALPAAAYPHRVLPNLSPRFLERIIKLSRVNPTLPAKLSRYRPQVLVVYGYAEPLQLGAILWSLATRTPYLLLCDSNMSHGRRHGRIGSLKTVLVRAICRRAAGALAIGSSNRDYWMRHGVPAARIFHAPYAVRNEHFGRPRPAEQREALVERIGLTGRSIVLYVGRLVPCKALETLLGAYAAARTRRADLALVLVGEGPLRRELGALVERRGIPDVVFSGAVDQGQLPLYYQSAAVLVLPSLVEPWGLVVNEAMAAGLPVIVSDQVGCHTDLVRPGRNGHVFPAGDEPALAAAILDVLADEAGRARMGRASAELIRPWSFEAAATGHREAIKAAVRRDP